MAVAVGDGIKEAGKEAQVVPVSGADMEELKKANVFALGCPSMGCEVLEESEMEPFVEEVSSFVAGASVLNGEGLICQETPREETLAACKEIGKQLAGLV